MKPRFPKKVKCRWCYPETVLTIQSEQELVEHMRKHDGSYKTIGVEYTGKGFKAIYQDKYSEAFVARHCCYVMPSRHIPHKTHIGPVQQEVLELLADGKVHKTNELPLGPDTSHGSWKNRPYEYRHMKFDRQRKQGNIERVSKQRARIAEWHITAKGLKRLQDQ
jgi:hypothetical protein